MRRADTARLVLLGAIWGASFLFMRIATPSLGPLLMADLRVFVAGVALALYFLYTGFDPQWRRFGRHYIVVGLLNSGVPFALYGYAALSLTAGLMSVINATSPMWGALLSAVLLRERFSARRAAGLVLGIAGVAIVTQPEGGETASLAVAASLLGAFCYGLTGVYMRRWATGAPVRGMAVGTQLSAGVLLLPVAALGPPPGAVTPAIVASVLALGLVCGAIAYLLYFRLITDIGPTAALTVTYLVPLFGVLWGALFLGEPVGFSTLAGAALVIAGALLVLRH